jgi:GT2 family glycosyltransferase
MDRHSLTIIIPTKDRPDEVRRLLSSIIAQDYVPLQIIIVDGGQREVAGIPKEFPSLKIDHIRVLPPSLTAQRNAGIRAVSHESEVVIFFDDDVVLADGALRKMVSFLAGSPAEVGGAGFNLTNETYRRPSVFEILFMVNADVPCMVLRSGFQSRISCLENTSRVDWLPGCAMAWKKDVFRDFMFDERFSGYARYEEVDFSYRVGKRYDLYIVAEAKAQHLSRVEDTGFSYSLGKMEVVNRLYFVRKNPDLSAALCFWALTGMLANNIIKGVFLLQKRYLERARGNLAGLLSSLL